MRIKWIPINISEVRKYRTYLLYSNDEIVSREYTARIIECKRIASIYASSIPYRGFFSVYTHSGRKIPILIVDNDQLKFEQTRIVFGDIVIPAFTPVSLKTFKPVKEPGKFRTTYYYFHSEFEGRLQSSIKRPYVMRWITEVKG